MKKLTFWVVLLMELAYCSGSIASLLVLKIEAYRGNIILELAVAIVLLMICSLTVGAMCRRKKPEAAEAAGYMRTGITVSFGAVGMFLILAYIVLEPWGGYFL